MATISDDMAALLTATNAIITDVETVLVALATANNITPSQKLSLEAQITNLQAVQDALQAAIDPSVFRIRLNVT